MAARALRGDDVEILSVGIGPEIDLIQLNEIVSKSSYVFFAADFDRLIREISSEVASALICTGTNIVNHIHHRHIQLNPFIPRITRTFTKSDRFSIPIGYFIQDISRT